MKSFAVLSSPESFPALGGQPEGISRLFRVPGAASGDAAENALASEAVRRAGKLLLGVPPT
jgi:hypothetical protein